MAIATNPMGQLRIVLGASLVACCVALVAPSQAEAFSCFRSAGDNLLTIDLEGGEDVTITRDGLNFDVSSAVTPSTHCGATVNNVDTVDIDALGGAERITLDLSNGFFGPGATAESGMSEIEFSVHPGQCINCQFNDGDRFELIGGSGADSFNFFDDGINLNADADVEVSLLDPFRRTLIDTGAGADTVHGGAGIFTHQNRMDIDGGTGVDDLTGGGLVDTIDGEGSGDTVHGGDEDDLILGGSGDDLLFGDAGDDSFDGLSIAPDGADTFTGGLGTDEVLYTGRNQPLLLSIGDGANDGEAGEGDDLAQVEDLSGGTAGDELTGDGGDNTLYGGQGDDVIAGRGGDDEELGDLDADVFLQGDAPDGGDTIAGGSGTDQIDYGERSGAVSATLGGLADDGETGEADDVVVEDVKGGDGSDTIVGNGAANVLQGGKGDDSLAGGAAGADSLTGGQGTDTADYADREDELSISLDGEANDGAPGEGDSASTESAIGGSAPDDITGDAKANRLVGGEGDDAISGGEGRDRIEGGAGEDDEFGNAGDDRFRQGAADDGGDEMTGGSGQDTVDYRDRKDAVSVSFNGIQDDGGGVENDDVGADVENAIGGFGADLLAGSKAKNRLDGRDGEDRLRGEDDDDVLLGRDGKDRLSGQAGDDSLDGGRGSDVCSGGGGADMLRRCES